MLFDLRGRGRRRAVQGIYLSLAILMGGGLVLFGIGGNTNGGLFDAFKSGGTGGGNDIVQQRVDKAEKAVQVRPRDSGAWATLARLRFQNASQGNGYDQATGQFTAAGKGRLSGAQRAWERYLALKPPKPDPNTALLMVQSFSPAALNKPDKAVAAIEIVLDARKPSAPLFAQYAQLAYAAGQSRKADLAAKRAVALAPKDQRAALKSQLDSVKQAASGAGAGGAGGAPSTGAPPSPDPVPTGPATG